MSHARPRIPLWLKIAYTLYVSALVGVYSFTYGPANFLWFSDLALIATTAALWLESSFLASMLAVGIVAMEIAWAVVFIGRLISGRRFGGVDQYMFAQNVAVGVRALSLFHIFLPVLLLWLMHRLGYERRAWMAQTLVCWVVYPLVFWLTNPAENIDWAFGPGAAPQHFMPRWAYLIVVMLAVPALVYYPTHRMLLAVFGRASSKETASPAVGSDIIARG
jgi:hypothetical protein